MSNKNALKTILAISLIISTIMVNMRLTWAQPPNLTQRYQSRPSNNTILTITVTDPSMARDADNDTCAWFTRDADGYFDLITFKKPTMSPVSTTTLDDFTITQVDLKMIYGAEAATDDNYRIIYYVGTTSLPYPASVPTEQILVDWTPNTATNGTVVQLTNVARPGGGAWTWTDIGNIRIRAETQKTGSAEGKKFFEFEAWATVTIAETASIFIDPSSIADMNKAPDSTFTIKINATNLLDLAAYDLILRFNTTGSPGNWAINATKNELAGFFPGSPFIVANITDNYEGYSELTIGVALGTKWGYSGSGTLGKITFKVNSYGESKLHLSLADLSNSVPQGAKPIPHTTTDGYFTNLYSIIDNPIDVPEVGTFHVITISNSSVTGMTFSQADTNITFTVTGTDGTKGFCNVTIPKNFMWVDTLVEWTLYIDGNPATFDDISENATHTFLHFTYTHSPHEITIKSIYAVPEFTNTTAVLTIVVLVAAITTLTLRKTFNSRKNRGRTLEKQSQNTLGPHQGS